MATESRTVHGSGTVMPTAANSPGMSLGEDCTWSIQALIPSR